MQYKPDDIVKSCKKLESGLRMGHEGILACQPGIFCAPVYWTEEEVLHTKITKDMIIEKRKWLFQLLNDENSHIPCKNCHMVKEKRYGDIDFSRLGHLDIATNTTCNLRCSFCYYTVNNSFRKAEYNALEILKLFSPEDVEWDSAVDFNGGEPSLFPDLDEYLDYFTSRKIRVFLYTNGTEYRQSIYDGLKKGTISWVCTSLDAGTPASFLKIKQRDFFINIIENLTRYAQAGCYGGGKVAVKYIFCEDNCSDDDIAGFTYAMLAIRPQQIWLTFDFYPLSVLPYDSKDFGNLDYSKHVNAYIKMYLLIKKHGMIPGHFAERHLAAVSWYGKVLLEKVLKGIESQECETPQELFLENFRIKHKTSKTRTSNILVLNNNPFEIKDKSGNLCSIDLQNKRILIAPTCYKSIDFLKSSKLLKKQTIGFLDRDPVLQNKVIEGIPVYKYDEIQKLNTDFIILASPKQYENDIIETLLDYISADTSILILND